MYSILYVDDEPGLLEIAKLFLEQTEDFSVDTNISAQKVIDSGTLLSYDAIISDYQMPGMDGIGFLKAVRARFGDIPFILFTGKGREEVVIEAINNGADFYIQKGGDPKAQFAELAHKVRQAVARRQAERSLVESEKRLADIINFLPDATFAIDRLGHVIAWNRAIEEMTGIPSSEMLGKGDSEYAVPFYGTRRKILIDLIFEPDDVIAKNYSHIFHDKDILIADTTLPRPQGRTVTLMGKASPLYNRKGEIIGAIESIRDITGLKLAEEGLSRARKDWETIFRAIGHPALVLSADNRIIDANDATLAATGKTADELKGLRCYEVFHKPGVERPPESCPFEQIRKSGSTETSETEIEALNGYYAVTCTPVFSPDGKIEKVIHIAMDVTSRRKAEDELRAAYGQIAASEEELRGQLDEIVRAQQERERTEKNFRTLVDNAPDAIYIKTNNRFRYLNNAALRLFMASSAGELLGTDVFERIHPSFHDTIRERVNDLTVALRPVETLEEVYVRMDGSPVDVEVTAMPFQYEGEHGALVMVRDITSRKRSETELRAAYEQLTASDEELRGQYDALAQSEQQTRERESTIMSIFSAAPIGIGVVTGRTILRINERLCEMTGYSVEEMQGRDTRFLYPDDDEYARVGKIQLDKGMNSGPVRIRTRWKRRDGTIRDILLTGIALDPSNHDAGRVYTALDITEGKEKEKALQQANLVVENSPAVLFRWKAEEGWPVAFVSNNVTRFGYAPDELLSGRTPFATIVHPDDLARVAGEVEKYSREGTDQYRQEYRIIARDGRVFWVDDRTTIGRDTEGRITHYQGILFDITEQKQSENLIRESEEKYRKLVEQSRDGIFIAQDSRLVFHNPAFSALIGYSEEELANRSIADIIAPEDRELVLTRHKERTSGKSLPETYEFSLLRSDGTTRVLVRMSVAPITLDNRPATIGTLHNVTEDRKREEALRESEEHYRSLVESSFDGIAIHQNGTVVFVNTTAARLLGYEDPEAVIGKPALDIIHPDFRPQIASRIQQSSEEPLDLIHEKFLRADGSIIDVDVAATPCRWQGKPATYVTFRDITVQKKAEEALQQSEERLRLFIQQAPAALAMFDTEMRYLAASRRWIADYHLGDLEILGHFHYEIFPEISEELKAIHRRGLSGEVVCSDEDRFEREDGQVQWLSWEVRPWYTTGNAIGGIIIYSEDITKRKQAEEALRESEARLQSILHGSPVLQFVIDNNHRLISWNRAIEEYSGIPAADVLDTDQQWRAFYPEKRPVLADLLVDGNTDGLYKWYGGKLEKSRYVEGAYEAMDFFPNMGPDGKWLTFTAAPVRDAKGTIIGAVETLEDITDRKKTEDAFLEKTEELDQYFTVSLDLLCIADTDGYFRRLNPEWEKTLGYPLPELNGKKFLDFVHPDDVQDTLSAVADLADQKKVLNFTNRFRHKDGTYRWIEWRSYPKGNLIYAAARDITERKLAEQSLQQSRDSFRSFIDHAYDAVIIHDSDGRVVEVNATMLAMYRLTRKEALATTISDLSGPDNPVDAGPWKDVLAGKDLFLPWQARRPNDGSLFDVEVYLTRILIGGRAIILANVRDVTERKRAETALRESEERYKRIFESFVDIYFEIDREGIIRVLSPSVYPLSGWKPEELIGKPATTVYSDPSDRDLLLAQLERDEGLHAFEVMLKKRDGTKTPVSINARIRLSPGGQPDGLIGSIHDISGTVKARKDLEESERKYRHILENMQDAYFQTDTTGKIIMVNPAAVRLYGYESAEEMIGLPAESLYSEPVEREGMIRKLQDAGRLMDLMGVARRRDGSTFLASLNVQFRYDVQGQVAGTESNVRDITERRMMEHAIAEANRKLNLLSSITRHDVANQLTILKGYAQIAAIKKPDPVIRDLLMKIDTAADTISRHIEFSKTYQELGVNSPSWFSVGDIVEKAGVRRVRFSNTCRGHEIFADPLLENVFFNLFDNAVRHGEHVTEIVVRCERAPGGLIVIVEDNGVGIPLNLKEKIFEKGFGKNTGYGLFLAREILSLTGITIRETGLYKEGARFEILVPKQSFRFVPPGRNKREEEPV